MKNKTIILSLSLLTTVLLSPAQAKDAESALEKSERVMLSQGYAQLNDALGALRWTDKLFLIKFESEPVEKFGQQLSKTADQLRERLQQVTASASWIKLDDTGLPEIEQRKLAAVQHDRLKSFAPLIGRSQANFERTLLLSNSGALNQLQHLAQVMLELETQPQRREFLEQAQAQFSELYEQDIQLLNARYFCHDTGEESKDFR